MKLNVLALLVVAGATGSLMSMLPDFFDMQHCKKLTFILDPECRIIMCSIRATQPILTNDNVGKNLFDIPPFKDSEFRVSPYNFLKNTRTYRESVTLQDKEFLVKYAVIEAYPLPNIYLKLKAMDNL